MAEMTGPMGTSAVPSFVTVTLAPTDSICGPAEPRTMRVPIAATTTVRELAKAAMKRYMLSLRRHAPKGADGAVRELHRSGIVVTDVFLLFPTDAARPGSSDGASVAAPAQQVIELFSDDCVVQVVQVMKETVHMRFRAADAIAAAAAGPADASAGATGGKSRTGGQPASPLPQTASGAARADAVARPPCVIDVEETSNTVGSVVASSTTLPAAAPAATAASLQLSDGKGDDDEGDDGARAVAERGDSAPSSTNVSGASSAPAAKASAAATVVSSRSVSAENSCSNVASITATKRPIKPYPTTHRAQGHSSSVSSSGSSSGRDSDSDADDGGSSSGDDSEAERQKIAQSIATLRQHETQRMRWGPDAHKHFAANYVSSPHKIMKGRYKCGGGGRPPPSVQLHRHASISSTCSSPGSISRAQSPRALLPDAARDAPSSARLAATPPPPTQPRKRDSIDAEVQMTVAQDEAAPQALPEPPLKTHCGEGRTPASRADTIAARSAVSFPVSPSVPSSEKARRLSVLPAAERLAITAAVCVTQPTEQPPPQQTRTAPLPPSPPLASTVVDGASAFTPVSAAARPGTSPAVPGTVAKPVVGVVARQLRFEEEAETAVKDNVASACLNTAPVWTVLRVNHAGAERAA